MSGWCARAVLFVADIDHAADFYVRQLGFAEAWRHQDSGRALVVQVERDGCELILSSQQPEKTGHGMMFISLNRAVFDALRAELGGKGVDVKEGHWGYRVLIIEDPDGNQLYFPVPD